MRYSRGRNGDDLHLRASAIAVARRCAGLFKRADRRILVGWRELRTQRLITGEDVQRQIAVVFVLAVEEPLPDGRRAGDVGRIQIEHHVAKRGDVPLHVEIAEQPIDGFGLVADLVVAPAAAHQFHPVQHPAAPRLAFEQAKANASTSLRLSSLFHGARGMWAKTLTRSVHEPRIGKRFSLEMQEALICLL
jgi:hypothetical protein